MVAKTLIDFDTKFSKLFSGKPASEEESTDGVDLKEFKDVFATGNLFAAGMSIDYADSDVSAKVKSKAELAKNLKVGERFYSAQVVNAASATPDQLTTRIPFTGAYRMLIFAGNVAEKETMDRLNRTATYLDGPESPVSKYTPSNLPRWSVIDPVTIRECRTLLAFYSRLPTNFRFLRLDSSPRTSVELYDLPQPSIFHPHNYKRVYVDEPSCESLSLIVSTFHALVKCSRMPLIGALPFPTDHRGDGKAYETYGIDKEVGAIVVVRPDQCESIPSFICYRL